MRTFREFLRSLNEMAHVSLASAGGESITLRGIRGVERIDMCFETYWFIPELRSVAAYWSKFGEMQPFVARLPGDPQRRYLIHRGMYDDAIGTQEEAKKTGFPEAPKGWEKAADVMGFNGEFEHGAGAEAKAQYMGTTG